MICDPVKATLALASNTEQAERVVEEIVSASSIADLVCQNSIEGRRVTGMRGYSKIAADDAMQYDYGLPPK